MANYISLESLINVDFNKGWEGRVGLKLSGSLVKINKGWSF